MMTAIWQAKGLREHAWIAELFGGLISDHVTDGERQIVMDDCLVIDNFIHTRPLSYYQRFEHRHNAYLLHLSDEQYHGGYKAYKYFSGVFRNYGSSAFNTARVMTLPLGYSNGTSPGHAVRKPAASRMYAWSFAGDLDRGSRPEMYSELRGITPHYSVATDRSSAPLAPDDYQALLRDSIFAPSPMGRVNLECFRLYEALECGAIPIVEQHVGFDYFGKLLGKHPLITVKGWRDAAALMKRLLSSKNQLVEKQVEVYEWWRERKAHLQGAIAQFIANTQQKTSSDAVRWFSQLPGWQLFELSRHHSPKALLRRLQIQVQRLRTLGLRA